MNSAGNLAKRLITLEQLLQPNRCESACPRCEVTCLIADALSSDRANLPTDWRLEYTNAPRPIPLVKMTIDDTRHLIAMALAAKE